MLVIYAWVLLCQRACNYAGLLSCLCEYARVCVRFGALCGSLWRLLSEDTARSSWISLNLPRGTLEKANLIAYKQLRLMMDIYCSSCQDLPFFRCISAIIGARSMADQPAGLGLPSRRLFHSRFLLGLHLRPDLNSAHRAEHAGVVTFLIAAQEGVQLATRGSR